MACEHDWTFQFVGVNEGDPFEIRPVSMSLKLSREKYDFCKAKVPWEVGQEMKPETRFVGGKLYGITPVDVCYNGQAVQRLMFRPDWVDYGNEFTHLRFHDLQKALSDGIIDIARKEVQLEEIYRTVVEKADNRFIDEIVFTVPESQTRTLIAEGTGPTTTEFARQKENEEETTEAVSSIAAIDFNEISPELAIRKLNKKFGLKSWVNQDGQLVVGLPEAKGIPHLAAPDDSRVWRYKDPQISHNREPIKEMVVQGAWVDEPGFDFDASKWFDKGGVSDVRAMGVATRTDIDYGQRLSVKATGVKKGSLDTVSRLLYNEKMKKQHSGTVEIAPTLSGTEVSNVIDLEVGDLLHLVPDDNPFDNPTAESGEVGTAPKIANECVDFTNNEKYRVTEVEHNLTQSGSWNVFADVSMYSDVPISTKLAYFNPVNNKWIDSDQIADDGSLKDPIIGIENISNDKDE